MSCRREFATEECSRSAGSSNRGDMIPMKSRASQMSRTGSSYAMTARAASLGPVAASGSVERDGDARQTMSDSPGGASRGTVPLTHEQIAERAKTLWLASGCRPGRDEQNWLEAEAQLKAELKSA